MAKSPETFTYTDEQDAMMDHFDHTGITPDEIRRSLDIKPDTAADDEEEPFMTPADHKPATRKAAARVQWGDNASVETPNGQPHYYEPFVPLSKEQAERNHHGATHWREMGAVAVQQVAQLREQLQTIDADIAATTTRRAQATSGAAHGRETNRLEILGQQRAHTLAKLEKLGGDFDKG